MFVSKKILKKNNDILFKRNTELNKVCIYLQQGLKERDKEIENLMEKNRDIEGQLVTTSEILDTKQEYVYDYKL